MTRKKSKKNERFIGELLDISQYSLDTTDANVTESNIKSVERELLAKKISDAKPIVDDARVLLDALIMQDLVMRSPSVKKKSGSIAETPQPAHLRQQPVVSAPLHRPSMHIVDLRKQYLIEKYRLDTIEKPRRSAVETIGKSISSFFVARKMTWHFPIKQAVTLSISEPENEIDETSIPHQGVRMSSGFVFALVLFFILAPIPAITTVSRLVKDKESIVRRGLAAVTNLKAGVASLSDSQYETAAEKMAVAQQNFDEINQNFNQYNALLLKLASVAPGIGKRLTLARNLTIIGESSSEIGRILSVSLAGASENITVPRLEQLRVHFKAIHAALLESRNDIMDIQLSEVSGHWSEALVFVKSHLDSIIDNLDRLDDLLTISHHIVGGDSTSRYLFIFQNNRELRPTGGFIGSYALVDFVNGKISNIEYPGTGSYQLAGGSKEHLIPPRPISILNPEWHIWDANWWPDFHVSAKKIAKLYAQSAGATVDGVIAVNSDVMIDLLRLVGPIELPEYNVTIDEKNFYTVIQAEVELGYDKSLNQPKKILKDLLPLLIEKISLHTNYQQFLTLLTGSLKTKDIQIAVLNNDAVQSSVERLGWAGRLKDTPKDYLAVISTNIAGEKSDASLYQVIDHNALIDDSGKITVTVKITKEHRATPEDPLAFVNSVDYLRMYVPIGSTLLSASGFQAPDEKYFHAPEEYQKKDEDLLEISGTGVTDQQSGTLISTELNHTVFANWMQVLPGHTASASISYVLPFRVSLSTGTGVKWLNYWQPDFKEVDSYSLLVQKQSGKRNVILNSSVAVGSGFKILWSDAADPGALAVNAQTLNYGTKLDDDTFFAVLLSRQRP